MTILRSSLALVLVLMAGCATAPPETAKQPPSVDVTGTWSGTWMSNIGSLPIELKLQQAGASVTGTAVISGDAWTVAPYNGPLTGTVSGNAFSYTYQGGGGDVTVQTTEMRGTTNSGKSLLMRRQ